MSGSWNTRSTGGLNYTHFIPEAQTKFSVGADVNGAQKQYNLRISKALDKNWSAQLGIQASRSPYGANNTIYAGFSYAFGGNSSEYRRHNDSSSYPFSARTVVESIINDPTYRISSVAATGKVVQESVKRKVGESVVDTEKVPDAFPTPVIEFDPVNGDVLLRLDGVSAPSGTKTASTSSKLPNGYTLKCSINNGTQFDCTSLRIPLSKFIV